MAKAKETTTAVSVQGQFTTNDVPALLAQAQAKLEELSGPAKGEVKEITSSLPGFGRIQDIDSLEVLIKAASSIRGKEAGYKAAFKKDFAGLTGKKQPAFAIEGHSASLWIKNLQGRYVEIASKEEIAKVKEAISILEDNLSKDAKFNASMQKIAGIFREE